jgi:hypothetical protein
MDCEAVGKVNKRYFNYSNGFKYKNSGRLGLLVCHWHDYSPQNTLWLGMTLTTLELLRLQSGSDSTFEDEVTLQNVLVSAQLMPQVCIAPQT